MCVMKKRGLIQGRGVLAGMVDHLGTCSKSEVVFGRPCGAYVTHAGRGLQGQGAFLAPRLGDFIVRRGTSYSVRAQQRRAGPKSRRAAQCNHMQGQPRHRRGTWSAVLSDV